MIPTHPILSCSASTKLEASLLGTDEAKIWQAMNRAGRGVGQQVIRDFQELGQLSASPRLLILTGTGHNAGDALLAADEILQTYPAGSADIIFTAPLDKLKPHTQQALELLRFRPNIVEHLIATGLAPTAIAAWLDTILGQQPVDIGIDGLLGMACKPPLREPSASLITAINASSKIRFRAAVDLPSGLGDEAATLSFRADFTYATGIAKAPLFCPAQQASVGRIRYVDIGFFAQPTAVDAQTIERLLLPTVLAPLRRLRPTSVDKRSFGHLLIIAGSRKMPGALLMATKAALRSGIGLLTVYAPASIAHTFAAVCPEAMWVPWPETANGGLAQAGLPLLDEKLSQATGLLLGPGMGTESETQALLAAIVQRATQPIMLDADALQPGILPALQRRGNNAGPIVMTPHQGEFQRMAGQEELQSFSQRHGLITVLKGPATKIADGRQTITSTLGGPILARGGSGDILSGLCGSRLAQPNIAPLLAVCQAVAWHGLAADALARSQGHTAVTTTDLLAHLSPVLRSADNPVAPDGNP